MGLCLACSGADLSVPKQEPVEVIPALRENGESLDSGETGDVVENEACHVDEHGAPEDPFSLSKDNSDKEWDVSVTKQEPVEDIPAIRETDESLDSGDVVEIEEDCQDVKQDPREGEPLSQDNSDEEWEWPQEQVEQAAPVVAEKSQDGEIDGNLNIWSYFQLIKGGDGDKVAVCTLCPGGKSFAVGNMWLNHMGVFVVRDAYAWGMWTHLQQLHSIERPQPQVEPKGVTSGDSFSRNGEFGTTRGKFPK